MPTLMLCIAIGYNGDRSKQDLYSLTLRGGIGRVEEKGAVLLCKTHRKADILTDPLLTVV